MVDGLSLNIDWESNSLDYDLAMSVAQDFRVDHRRANEIIEKIKKEVREWDSIAESQASAFK